MTTEQINVEGLIFTGKFEAYPNGTGYNFRLENGNYLTAYYKQGYYGTKEIEVICRFNKNKKFEYSFNNSNRQVKDPNAYFLHF